MKYFFQFFSEIILICVYPIFGVLVNFLPKTYFENHGEGPTIVLVERWLTFNVRHLYWKRYLEKRGHKVYIKNFPLISGDYKESAKSLKRYVDSLELDNITLVGISGGGITSLLYLENENGWEKVKNFISVGSPFKGTWSSLFVSFTYSGREMLPVSNLVKKISNLSLTNPKKTYCIKAKFDEMVPSGTVLPSANKITIDVVGHNNLHLSIKTTYREIIKIA